MCNFITVPNAVPKDNRLTFPFAIELSSTDRCSNTVDQ